MKGEIISLIMLNISNVFLYRNVLSSVKSNLDLQGGISILDVGCGPGVWSMVSHQHLLSVIFQDT